MAPLLPLLLALMQSAPEPSGLEGLKPAELRARIGTPHVAHAEGHGAFWTYRLQRCALMVFFSTDPNGRNLRVSGAEAGPRRKGDPVPPLARCVADAEVEKPQ